MAEYYLMSQLPSLDAVSDNIPLPITEERFLELCERFLNKKAQIEINRLTLIPNKEGERSNSALVEAWNEGERNLRLALCRVRAEKLKKPFDDVLLPLELVKIANIAVEMSSPLEAENFLNNYRMQFLETLRPMDTFSEDFVFYYSLKLKLILRSRQFKTELGQAAYRNIYDSILNGKEQEAI